MDIFKELEKMQRSIFDLNWDEFEEKYKKICAEFSGEPEAEEIAAIDFNSYEKKLGKGLLKAIKAAKNKGAKAIYFEYDLDNYWQSYFFICNKYNKMKAEDDEWACDYIIDIEGPEFEELSGIYLDTDHFCNTDEATGITLYLIARTVSSFGRVVEESDVGDLVVTIAFHDQEPSMRLKEDD